MRITIAVCTWNRADLLRQTLLELSRMSSPAGVDVDVLVVNNNCTDATDAVIDECRARLPLRRAFEPRPGVSHARNAALDAASGDYVAFVDDDALVDREWLVELKAAIDAFPAAAAIGGAIDPWFPKPADADLLQAFQWLRSGFCGLDHDREPGPLPDHLIVHGPNMAYQRAAIGDRRFSTDLGGTPSSTMGGDERDLLGRLRAAGGTVVWWPRMRVRHHVLPSRMTLDYCLRFAADKGREHVRKQDAEPAPTMLGAPRWLWRRWATVWLASVASRALPRTVERLGPASLSGPRNGRASRRVRTLEWRRELAFVGGMISAHRDRRHGGAATLATPPRLRLPSDNS